MCVAYKVCVYANNFLFIEKDKFSLFFISFHFLFLFFSTFAFCLCNMLPLKWNVEVRSFVQRKEKRRENFPLLDISSSFLSFFLCSCFYFYGLDIFIYHVKADMLNFFLSTIYSLHKHSCFVVVPILCFLFLFHTSFLCFYYTYFYFLLL